MVARNTPWEGGLVAVNSFGFGGANAHAILESQPGARPARAQCATPRLVLASGRTEAAVRQLLALAREHAADAELHALLDAVHALPVAGHTRRGYLLLPDGAEPLLEVAVGGPSRSFRSRLTIRSVDPHRFPLFLLYVIPQICLFN